LENGSLLSHITVIIIVIIIIIISWNIIIIIIILFMIRDHLVSMTVVRHRSDDRCPCLQGGRAPGGQVVGQVLHRATV
jgi:hypothetical protein